MAPSPALAPARRRLPGPERRERIVRAAMGVFARKGFAGASTREIARASGISEAMLFKHFPGKDALYVAILGRKVEEAEAALPLAELAASEEPPERFLGRVGGYLLRRVEEDPTFVRLLFYAALEGHPLAPAFDRARGSGIRRVVADYLGRRAKAGEIRVRDPVVAARAYLGSVGWIAVARVVFREPESLRISRDRWVREILALFLAGILPRRRGA